MTKHEDYPTQVADLVQQAFGNLGDGLAREPGDGREDFLAEAQLQIQTAQAVATLEGARVARIQALIDLATAVPADGSSVNPQLVQEAYESAAVMLGLVEEPVDLEGLKRALAGESDPADADHGDLP